MVENKNLLHYLYEKAGQERARIGPERKIILGLRFSFFFQFHENLMKKKLVKINKNFPHLPPSLPSPVKTFR